ncbi:MAG: helix-turn-helix domain-containing protein [Candidatus Limnocylindria bacterium]
MAIATAPRTGLDLRLRRTAAMVTQTQLAAAIGVSRQAVSNVEALYRPSEAAVARYLTALERLAHS